MLSAIEAACDHGNLITVQDIVLPYGDAINLLGPLETGLGGDPDGVGKYVVTNVESYLSWGDLEVGGSPIGSFSWFAHIDN